MTTEVRLRDVVPVEKLVGNDLFNAGSCTGWIEALLEDRDIFAKR